MAIKFGDLIENINADQAVIDLLSNNAKGLLFVGDFSNTASDGVGVQGIPLAKRGLYTIVLDSATGNLYAFIGSNFDVGNNADGAWEDTTSVNSNWVQIGQVPIRQTDLYANISPGPEPFGAGTPSNLELKNKINEIINNPPQTFGQFKTGDLVVGAGEDLNALDIIIRALSATQAYDLSIDLVSGTIEFGQTSGTVSLNGSVTSVNYNLLNANNNNIIPTQYKWYYREKGVGAAEWQDVGAGWVTISDTNFNSSTSEFTNLTATHTWDDQDYTAGQFAFQGWEYQLELRDNSDGTANISGSESVFVSGSPVVAIDTDLNGISMDDYVAPSASINLTRSTAQIENDDSDDGSNYAGNSITSLRLKGALSSQVIISITPSSANANGPQATVLPITDLRLDIEKSINGGAFSATTLGANSYTTAEGTTNPTQTNQSYTTTVNSSITMTNTQVHSDAAELDAIQFKLYYKDASSANWQLATTSNQVKFRMPVFAGFSAITTGITTLTDDSTLNIDPVTLVGTTLPSGLTEAAVKGLSFTTGGWSAGAANVPAPYKNVAFAGSVFPRIDSGMGFAEDADDTTPTSAGASSGGYQYQSSVPSTYGWIHNSDLTYSGQNGGATSTPTRFIMAFPNDGYSWGNLFSGSAQAEPSFPLDITINGVTQEYRVNLSNFNTNYNSTGAQVTLVCLVET